MRADLDECVVALFYQVPYAVEEPHRLPQILHPVPGVQLGPAEKGVASGGVERDRSVDGGDTGQRGQQVVTERIHGGRVGRDIDADDPVEDPGLLQALADAAQRGGVSCQDRGRGRVLGGDAYVLLGGDEVRGLLGGDVRRHHRALPHGATHQCAAAGR